MMKRQLLPLLFLCTLVFSCENEFIPETLDKQSVEEANTLNSTSRSATSSFFEDLAYHHAPIH